MKQVVLAVAATAAVSALSHAATIRWDNGGGDGVWATGTNWYNETTSTDTNTIPGSSDTAKFDGAGPSTVSLGTTSSTERTINTLLMDAGQTTAVSFTTARIKAFNVTVNSGSANHTLSRWQAAGAMNANIADSTQTFTASALESGFNTLTKQGAGTLLISNWINAHQRGTITVSGGTLDIRNSMDFDNTNPGNNDATGALLSGASGTTLTNGGTGTTTWVFGRKNTSTATFAGSISGPVNFQLGAKDTNYGSNTEYRTAFDGAQTLSGANTYTGTTTVRQGRLYVNGTHTGGGNYLVTGTTSATQTNSQHKTGTLGGTGSIGLQANATFTVGGTQLANSRGMLYPGASNADTAQLTIGTNGNSNKLIFGEKSTLKIDVGSAGQSDRVTLLGDLDLQGVDDRLDLSQLSLTSLSGTYTLLSFTGARLGEFGSVWWNGAAASDPTTQIGSTGYKLSYSTNSIQLVAVPEPTTLALLGLAALPMFRRRRVG